MRRLEKCLHGTGSIQCRCRQIHGFLGGLFVISRPTPRPTWEGWEEGELFCLCFLFDASSSLSPRLHCFVFNLLCFQSRAGETADASTGWFTLITRNFTHPQMFTPIFGVTLRTFAHMHCGTQQNSAWLGSCVFFPASF